MNKLIYLIPAIGLLTACSPQTYVHKQPLVMGFKKTASDVAPSKSVEPIEVRQQPLVGMMPKATAFKMNGLYPFVACPKDKDQALYTQADREVD